ncbi:MAG TPA: hypothetical protein VIL08_08010, partial [Limnochorda sp.]
MARPSGRRSSSFLRFSCAWLLAGLLAAWPQGGTAEGLPVRPVLDAENGVVGAELFAGSGPWEFFAGGGYGLFSGQGHSGAGASLSGIGQKLTILYRNWPGSLVQGRDGQTGAGVRYTWSPAWGPILHLNAFQGTLWTHDGRLEPEEAWLVTSEASYGFRLGDQWMLTPRLISVYGRSQETGSPFTSQLLTARLRRGWTGLQVAAGHLWAEDLDGFRWELG